MNKSVIQTSDAPKAIGTYSQGIRSQNLIFTSGQIPINPKTGELIIGDFKAEAHQVLTNLDGVLKGGGSSLQSAVKLTVFLTDLTHAPIVNKLVNKWFDSKSYPARSMVEVCKLPLNSSIEIECIAVKDE